MTEATLPAESALFNALCLSVEPRPSSVLVTPGNFIKHRVGRASDKRNFFFFLFLSFFFNEKIPLNHSEGAVDA